jgi:glucoamylase
VPAEALIGLDFLYLVRLGLREAGDPRVESSLKVVDATLRVDTPSGPAYHRYQLDGYGEHENGDPFDGTGVGRAWPLLTGERGYGALLVGDDPLPYLRAMTRMTGPGGLIPEQVWDSEPIPERYLFPGKPSGSAMPLVWAHAEFLKLLAAVHGRRVELLESVLARYGRTRPEADTWFWRHEVPVERLPAGRALVVEGARPFRVHFGWDGWQTLGDRESVPLGLARHGVRFEPGELAGRGSMEFTRFLHDESRWEGSDHAVRLG